LSNNPIGLILGYEEPHADGDIQFFSNKSRIILMVQAFPSYAFFACPIRERKKRNPHDHITWITSPLENIATVDDPRYAAANRATMGKSVQVGLRVTATLTRKQKRGLDLLAQKNDTKIAWLPHLTTDGLPKQVSDCLLPHLNIA
jgi:hypothetical protein